LIDLWLIEITVKSHSGGDTTPREIWRRCSNGEKEDGGGEGGRGTG